MNNTDLIRILAGGPFKTNENTALDRVLMFLTLSMQPYQNSRIFCCGMYIPF